MSGMSLSRKKLVIGGLALILVTVGMVLVNVQMAGDAIESVPPPSDDAMRLTVPKMERVKNVPVYTSSADDEAKLGAGTLHLAETGFPWEPGSNVYIAGHRLGYPNTRSFLVFYDLNKLKNGDRVVLKDAVGRRYIYQVFNEFVTDPMDYQITQPVAGKNIVSLQTCTLPDYSKRLVVQAELIRIREAPVQASAG